MADPIHAYSPEQYARAVEAWARLAELSGADVDLETVYAAVLSDGERDSQYDRIELSFCYSSDYSGSEYDRANARCLANSYPFLGHMDDHGGRAESYVYTTLGELPCPLEFDLEDVNEAISQLERLADDLDYVKDDYPVLDEQYLYDLEAEVEEESWGAYFMSDFRWAVCRELGCYEDDLFFDFQIDDDKLKEMFYEVYYEEYDLSFRLENATSGYFEGWEDIVAPRVADNIVKAWREVYVDPNQLTLV